ncbi:hypothetical protein [Agrobacterium tumefaciens]|uniref:hypothetical protein n=1 Tax=Agrobacterium tumefaciens TaxID=358 RepID=UPI000552CB23|nr:hypothetical protein [Agrobacterium tumefaciens]
MTNPAEHLRYIVDAAVAVPVPHQKIVISLQPAGTFREEIAVHVEINFAGSYLGRLYAERVGNMQTLKPVRTPSKNWPSSSTNSLGS